MGNEEVTLSRQSVKGIYSAMSESLKTLDTVGVTVRTDNGEYTDKDVYVEGSERYTLADFSKDCFGVTFERLDINMDNAHQFILVGVPGTGKTTVALAYVRAKTGFVRSKYYELITFGKDWGRSDFTGGTINVDGIWRKQRGILMKMCDRALSDKEHNYYLIIDEINRGDTAAIMADAFTGLSQRGVEYRTQLGDYIQLPENLYIIGTMNAFDKSIADLDMAMKNRFPIIELQPVWNDKAFVRSLPRIIGAEEFGWSDSWLSKILDRMSGAVAELNEVIVSQGDIGNASVVGVRSICKKFKSLAHFREAYNNELLYTIRDNVEFIKDVPEVAEQLEEFSRILTDIDRRIERES